MEHDEILFLCHSNPEAIVDHIESLEIELNETKTELNEVKIESNEFKSELNEVKLELSDAKEEIKNLKALLNQTSRDSNKPPSTDLFVKKKAKSEQKKGSRRPGGQKGHPGSTLKTFDSPHEIVNHRLCNCKFCGNDLQGTEAKGHEKRQEIDIPFLNFRVIEHRVEIKKCPYCGRKNKADFPEHLTKPVQYSQRVLAIAVYLRDLQLIPYARISRTLKDLFGLNICPATVKRAEEKYFQNLKEVSDYIKEHLIKENVVSCDETGMRVKSHRDWCHVISTNKFTLYFHDKSRGSEAMDKMGVLPEYQGIIIHDFWKSYFKYQKCKHAACNAHIIRELKGIIKNFSQDWPQEMIDLLTESKEHADKRRELGKEIEEKEVEALREKYRRIVMKGFEVNPPPKIPEDQKGKKGRTRQGKARNLLERLAEHEDEILRFATDLHVPFDNNQAERDLRMVRVQQNISGCFRTPQGADAFCRNRGYISTIMKNLMSVIDSLYAALQGEPPIPE